MGKQHQLHSTDSEESTQQFGSQQLLSLSQQVDTQRLRSQQPNSASIRWSLRGLTHLSCDYQGWRQSWEILCKKRGCQGVLGIALGTRQVLLVKPEYVILALWRTTGMSPPWVHSVECQYVYVSHVNSQKMHCNSEQNLHQAQSFVLPAPLATGNAISNKYTYTTNPSFSWSPLQAIAWHRHLADTPGTDLGPQWAHVRNPLQLRLHIQNPGQKQFMHALKWFVFPNYLTFWFTNSFQHMWTVCLAHAFMGLKAMQYIAVWLYDMQQLL